MEKKACHLKNEGGKKENLPQVCADKRRSEVIQPCSNCLRCCFFLICAHLRRKRKADSATKLLYQPIQHFFRLLMKIRRRAVSHARGFAGTVKYKHSWDGRDVSKSLGRCCIGNGPMQIEAKGVY